MRFRQSPPEPPRLGEWIVSKLFTDRDGNTSIGDFEEGFVFFSEEKGLLHARFWYWKQVLASLYSFVVGKCYWRLAMLKNYMKVALRNLIRHKGYSTINILGLAIGMASCVLILMWIHDELSWDRFHENADRLYRVVEEVGLPDGIEYRTRTPLALGPALKLEIPEISHVTRSILVSFILEVDDKRFTDDAIDFADPDFFEMYTLPLLEGDPSRALTNRHSIVLTVKTAQKYFGDVNPMGKTMRFLNQYDLTVTGIMADLPRNSHWHFDCLMPTEFWDEMGIETDSWRDFYTHTHVMLEKNADTKAVNNKIAGMIQKHRPESRIRLFLQPLTKIHLYALQGGGRIRYVYIFGCIALIILLIASINFMNLCTARSANRAKEIGMRKVVGALRHELIRQFLGEAILMSFMAFGFSLLLVGLSLPVFSRFTNRPFDIGFLLDQAIVIPVFLMALLTGFLSGSYPALILSAFAPVDSLKQTATKGLRGAFFRRILVIIQFALSVFLMIGTLSINGQLRYMQGADLGFRLDGLAFVSIPSRFRDGTAFLEMRNELLQHTNITGAARTSSLPGYIDQGTTKFHWEGRPADYEAVMHVFPVDYDYIDVMGMQLVEGRGFSRTFATDTSNYILNETAVRSMALGGRSPVGMRFSYDGREGLIIGIVRDFHHGSMHDPIAPLVLTYSPGFLCCIRFGNGDMQETIRFLEEKWKTYRSEYPFEITFLKDRYDSYYEEEGRLLTLMNISALLSIFISCLGLFGLAAFIVERRTKEVGIRKILGADVTGVVVLLSMEFIRWVALANIVAWPAAWIVLARWLRNYAYSEGLRIWMFVLAGAAALMIALLTVGMQSIRVARANPVDALRYE